MAWRHCSRGAIEWGFIASVVGGVGAVAVIVGIIYLAIATHKNTTIVPPDPEACKCPDLMDMFHRRDLANAAIKSIDALSNAQSAKDASEMYSDELYEPGKKANQKAISDAKTGAPPWGGETPPRNCSPIIPDEASTCMKASLLAHEDVHQRACLDFNSKLRNYKYAKTMVQFWQEDRNGYQAEVKFLTEQIDKCMHVSNYPSPESKEEQEQRNAGSNRRATKYGAGLPS